MAKHYESDVTQFLHSYKKLSPGCRAKAAGREGALVGQATRPWACWGVSPGTGVDASLRLSKRL